MREMFHGTRTFNGDLSGWNAEKCTDMDNMFFNAESFKGKGLSGWNVENCQVMKSMFNGVRNFNKGLVNNWNLKRKFCWCFTDCMFRDRQDGEKAIEEYKKQEELKQLENWVKGGKFRSHNLKKAVSEWCRNSGKAEDKYGHISGWDTSEVASTMCLFQDQKSFDDNIYQVGMLVG